jgi:alpha-glucoside transport system substrate-binding protein
MVTGLEEIMMRRSQLGLVVAVTAVLAVTGCDGGSGTYPPTSGLGGEGLPDLSGQQMEVIGEWTATEQDAFEAVLKNFADQTHAKITYTSGGNNVNVLIHSRLAGGAPPDVALIPQPGVVAQYAQKGQIKPLTGDAAAAVRANFSDAWQKLGAINGKQYGFFFKVANKSVIWYRAEAFSAAGVEPPATWDEFTKVSGALADSGTTAIAIPAADGWPGTDWFENVYLRVAGVDKYNQLSAHQIPWTDPTVVRSLQLLSDYVKQPGFVEKGATQLTFTQSVADVFGMAPKAAMLYEGDFVAGEIQKSGKVQVGTGAKFFTWPSINGSAPSVVTGGDAAIMFKDTPGAQALMAYLAGPQAAGIWAARGGFLSANKNLAPSTYPDGITREIGEAVVRSRQVVFDMSDQSPQAFGGQTGADEWKLLTEFFGSPGDPASTAAKLEVAAAKDYGST